MAGNARQILCSLKAYIRNKNSYSINIYLCGHLTSMRNRIQEKNMSGYSQIKSHTQRLGAGQILSLRRDLFVYAFRLVRTTFDQIWPRLYTDALRLPLQDWRHLDQKRYICIRNLTKWPGFYRNICCMRACHNVWSNPWPIDPVNTQTQKGICPGQKRFEPFFMRTDRFPICISVFICI